MSVFGVLNGLFLLSFLASAILQWNDPDPLQWIFIYSMAALCSYRAIKTVTPLLTLAVLFVCIVTAARLFSTIETEGVDYSAMMNSFSMASNSIEELREFGGLLLIAFWMTCLLVRHYFLSVSRTDSESSGA